MPSQLGTLSVRIDADTADLKKGLSKASAGITSFGSKAGIALGAAVAGFAALGVAAAKAAKAASIQIDAERALSRAIKNTGSAINASRIKSYASDLQRVTRFGDEATISAGALLASFKLQERTILNLLPLTQDLAAATGTSLQAAALKVAKSFTDGGSSLQEYTGQLDEAKKEILRTGDEAAKLEVIMGTLNERFGGTARDQAKSAVGAFDQLKNAFGDLVEQIGLLIEGPLTRMVQIITKIVGAINGVVAKTAKALGISGPSGASTTSGGPALSISVSGARLVETSLLRSIGIFVRDIFDSLSVAVRGFIQSNLGGALGGTLASGIRGPFRDIAGAAIQGFEAGGPIGAAANALAAAAIQTETFAETMDGLNEVTGKAIGIVDDLLSAMKPLIDAFIAMNNVVADAAGEVSGAIRDVGEGLRNLFNSGQVKGFSGGQGGLILDPSTGLAVPVQGQGNLQRAARGAGVVTGNIGSGPGIRLADSNTAVGGADIILTRPQPGLIQCGSSPAQNLCDSLDNLDDSVQDLIESITNAPSGFRVEPFRFAAQDPEARPDGGGFSDGGGQVVINSMQVGDTQEFIEKVKKGTRYIDFVESGTTIRTGPPMSVPFRGA